MPESHAESQTPETSKPTLRLIFQRIFTRLRARQLLFVGAASVVVSLFPALLAFLSIDFSYPSGVSRYLLIFGIFSLISAALVFSATYLEVFAEDQTNKLGDLRAALGSLQKQVDDVETRLRKIPVDVSGRRTNMEKLVERIFDEQIKGKIEEKLSGSLRDIVSDEMLKVYAPNVYKK